MNDELQQGLSPLQKRIISASVMISAVLIILYYGGFPFIVLLGVLALVSLYEWIRLSFHCKLPLRFIYLFAGFPYVIGSFVCCFIIFEKLGFFWAMTFLAMVWSSDTGAYFAGKTIGGPKLAQKISPNKTWAGFGGALLAPAVVGIASMFLYRGVDDFSWVALFMMGASGALIGFAGQMGDLVISAFKRQAGVKDSGDLIPGHGGLLDRIDSMLLAAPVYLILFMIGHA